MGLFVRVGKGKARMGAGCPYSCWSGDGLGLAGGLGELAVCSGGGDVDVVTCAASTRAGMGFVSSAIFEWCHVGLDNTVELASRCEGLLPSQTNFVQNRSDTVVIYCLGRHRETRLSKHHEKESRSSSSRGEALLPATNLGHSPCWMSSLARGAQVRDREAHPWVQWPREE